MHLVDIYRENAKDKKTKTLKDKDLFESGDSKHKTVKKRTKRRKRKNAEEILQKTLIYNTNYKIIH